MEEKIKVSAIGKNTYLSMNSVNKRSNTNSRKYLVKIEFGNKIAKEAKKGKIESFTCG